jgi:undecaprenyl-diphosphatase
VTAYHRRAGDARVLAAAVAATVLCSWAVSSGEVSPWERAAFGAVNGWPDALEGPLWVAQLVGVLGMPLLVAVPALLLRRWRLALALVLLVPLKLLVHGELIKGLVQRRRPGSTIPGAILRDVPSAGVAYPSGHAVVAAGIVVLLAPYVRRRWLVVLAALALLNAVARVYLGGHAPLDAVGGATTGIALGAALNLLVGVPPVRRGALGPAVGSRAPLPDSRR